MNVRNVLSAEVGPVNGRGGRHAKPGTELHFALTCGCESKSILLYSEVSLGGGDDLAVNLRRASVRHHG